MASSLTNTLVFIMSPMNMSLSTVQWEDIRKLTSNIIFSSTTNNFFCLYQNVGGCFPSYRYVLLPRGRPILSPGPCRGVEQRVGGSAIGRRPAPYSRELVPSWLGTNHFVLVLCCQMNPDNQACLIWIVGGLGGFPSCSTNSPNFFILPKNMSLSIEQWEDIRKLTCNIIFCPQQSIFLSLSKFRWLFSVISA